MDPEFKKKTSITYLLAKRGLRKKDSEETFKKPFRFITT